MDCADCAQKIERATARIPGVTTAQVFLSSSKLIISSGVTPNTVAIVQAIKQLGYHATLDEDASSVSLFISGMDCADEVRLLNNKLKGLSGLLRFEVQLASQRIDATYNPARLTSQDIIKAIAETGMQARLARATTLTKTWWQDPRVKLIAASGILLALAFVLDRMSPSNNTAWIIYGASIIIGGYYPAKMAIAGLRSKTLNIYTLLVLAAIGAIILGFWDEAAVLVFVYTWGAAMETFATEKARSSLRLLSELSPREALVKRNGRELTLPVEEVQVGDIIVVKPGEKIPLDGTVTVGSSTVDQAPITGESIAVSKDPGDIVFAASLNQYNSIEIKVSKLSNDTTLARIIQSVERSEIKKSSYQHFAERFGQIYTPVMFGVAIIVAVIPWLLGEPFYPWFYRGLTVLVVSCSCGLVLSVPISVLASVSAAARKGILIKGGADLEAAGKVEVMVFDKTGTLTMGQPVVTDVISYDGDTTRTLAIAAAIEARSGHPLADAIIRKARTDNVEVQPLTDVETLVGLGVRGHKNGCDYYICNRRLCAQMSIPLGQADQDLTRLESTGKTAVLVVTQGKILGIIAAIDILRPEAKDAVTSLRKNGIKRTIMLTGDNEATAMIIASQAGIDEYRAQLLPEDKVYAIKELREQYGRIAMVGDGINDAPALATADVGIAMGAAGTDIAIETCDMALMTDDLSRLSCALRISRKAITTIKQNVVAAIAIVVLVVTLALIGKIGLVPGLLINELSALVVMANGLRLLRG